MPSPLVHFQIAARNPEATAAFLKEVFDWEFGPGAGRVVATIDTGARQVDPNDIYPSGTLIQTRDGAAPYVSLFIRVADLDGTVAKAQALGATLILPRRRDANGTDVSIISAPDGLVIGIVQL